MKLKHALLLILGLSLFPSHSVLASEALRELIEILKARGSITAEEYQALTNLINEQESQEIEDEQVDVKTDGGLEVSSYDGESSIRVKGRVLIDATSYNSSNTTLGNGTELRNAKVELQGTMHGNWWYEFGIDFSDSDANIHDAFVSYQPSNSVEYKFGHFKEPFSLEELTNLGNVTFMERALINEFAPERSIGIGARKKWKNVTLSGGVFGESYDSDVSKEGDEGKSVTGRITYAPWHEDLSALHFGVAFSHRQINEKNEITYNARPESHLTQVKFLNTDDIENVDSVTLTGFEAAWVEGPFSLQGEYVSSRLNLTEANDLDFEGWYLYGSWFLTGESRRYRYKSGAFGKIKPYDKLGALELALRFSTLNLDSLDVLGGESKQWTLGANWYLNDNIRLMTNYIVVDNNENADDKGDEDGNDDLEIIQLRLQANF